MPELKFLPAGEYDAPVIEEKVPGWVRAILSLDFSAGENCDPNKVEVHHELSL